MGICAWCKGVGGGLMRIVIHSTELVPLYLLNQIITEKVRIYGDSIVEVRIRRTTGHRYILNWKGSAHRRLFHIDDQGS